MTILGVMKMQIQSKDDLTKWAYGMFKLYGIKLPEEYTEEELIEVCPDVPVEFIREHVRKRDEKTD